MMLMGALPKAVRGETRTEKSAAPDVAKGELTFENGAATLIASRLEDDFSRTMDITYPSGTVSIDFNAMKTLVMTPPLRIASARREWERDA